MSLYDRVLTEAKFDADFGEFDATIKGRDEKNALLKYLKKTTGGGSVEYVGVEHGGKVFDVVDGDDDEFTVTVTRG